MTLTSQKIRIKEINCQIVQMSTLVEKQLYASMLALKNHDLEIIDKIMKEDDKVDELQKKIEEECIKFIASEQPLAKDLRNVFTATKVVTDFERMADYSVDICKIIKRMNNDATDFEGDTLSLWVMEEKIRKMISLATNAYVNIDEEQAYEICKMDDEIDSLYKTIFESTLKNVKLDEVRANKNAQLLFVAKYLERVADHVTNICEWIIFSKTGEYVDLNE
ncbi:MAG: phosphate signaling complex protein PhoU [Clostridium sp.]|nr:phosphate signaling complex protein PhoU [Clostridium sp.]